MAKAFGQNRKLNTRERSELFVSRRNKRQLINFAELDCAVLAASLNCAMDAGATLSFAPAQGGTGVTLRVYRGDYADTEFAGSIEELEELLTLIVDGLGSTSEDHIEAAKLTLVKRSEPKRA